MDIKYLLTDILRIAGGGLITVAGAYYLIRPDIQKYFRLRSAGLKEDEHSRLLVLRLQAYERLIIFIERINPSNLFIRLHQQGISVKDFQSILLHEIRAEYQHNVSQQLYVSSAVWEVVNKLKDDTLAMINNAVRSLPPDAAGVDLSRKILQHIASSAENPYDLALIYIKKDIQKLF